MKPPIPRPPKLCFFFVCVFFVPPQVWQDVDFEALFFLVPRKVLVGSSPPSFVFLVLPQVLASLSRKNVAET